jgi:broad specificity phosphatase PhoE
MPNLILIKHASPQVVPGDPPERWHLSDEGRRLATVLGERLAAMPDRPAVVVSSDELKASETAEVIAGKLGVPMSTAPGLHEHDRSTVPQMRSGDFISMVELMLRKPAELVLGEETAAEAMERFDHAVSRVIEQHRDQTIAVVSHGTVIAMFVARHTNRPAFQIWREMGLPSYVVMSLPEYRVVGIVNRVD